MKRGELDALKARLRLLREGRELLLSLYAVLRDSSVLWALLPAALRERLIALLGDA